MEKQTKQPKPVQAVTAMIEQTHVRKKAMRNTVKMEEDDLEDDLEEDYLSEEQQYLEAHLFGTEEAFERLLNRLKRKAAAGRTSMGGGNEGASKH
ncbi:MAG: hypothetical protein Q9166_008078 [cf. Caloplaca sp. 2 TL-2023]